MELVCQRFVFVYSFNWSFKLSLRTHATSYNSIVSPLQRCINCIVIRLLIRSSCNSPVRPSRSRYDLCSINFIPDSRAFSHGVVTSVFTQRKAHVHVSQLSLGMANRKRYIDISPSIYRYVRYIERNMPIYTIYRKKYIDRLFFPK